MMWEKLKAGLFVSGFFFCSQYAAIYEAMGVWRGRELPPQRPRGLKEEIGFGGGG